MTRVTFFSISVSVLACGCEDVPALTFSDAAPDAPQDAGEAGSAEAGLETGCSEPNDASATPYVCCGSVACEGQCAGTCDLCANKCTDPETFCCAKTNNVVCLPVTSVCH